MRSIGRRESLGVARAQGIVVLLVTGRNLGELRRVAGDFHFVDGIIAENGAVIHFPASRRTSLLRPAVPEPLVMELRRRGIPCTVGHCIVDAHADDAPRVLEVIRALELPLVQVFNRGRVMIVPQGVSKATGLRVVLDTLRLSPRNTFRHRRRRERPRASPCGRGQACRSRWNQALSQ